jgi:hypothetical protein
MENQSKGAPQRGWSCVGAERTSTLYEARINGSVTDGEALIDARVCKACAFLQQKKAIDLAN